MTIFPPTFLIDGNNNSFLSQAQQFSNQLQDLGIPYTEVYYEESLAHEYQFDMSLPASLANYEIVLFLNTLREKLNE